MVVIPDGWRLFLFYRVLFGDGSVPFRCGRSLSAGRAVEPPRACGVSPARLTAGVDPPPLQGTLG